MSKTARAPSAAATLGPLPQYTFDRHLFFLRHVFFCSLRVDHCQSLFAYVLAWLFDSVLRKRSNKDRKAILRVELYSTVGIKPRTIEVCSAQRRIASKLSSAHWQILQ